MVECSRRQPWSSEWPSQQRSTYQMVSEPSPSSFRLGLETDSMDPLKDLLEEFRSDLQKQFSTIHNHLNGMLDRVDRVQHLENSVSSPDYRIQFQDSITSRFAFPIYDGCDDPSIWLKRATEYFSFHHTPVGHKVDIASCHLQGEALDWFWNILASRPSISWLDLVEEFKSQFSSARNHRQASFTHSLAPGTLRSNEEFTLSVQIDRNEHNPHGIVDNSASIVSPSASHHEDPISNVLEPAQMPNALVRQDMFHMTSQRYTSEAKPALHALGLHQMSTVSSHVLDSDGLKMEDTLSHFASFIPRYDHTVVEEQQQSVQDYAPSLFQASFEEEYNRPQHVNLGEQSYDLFTNRRSMGIQDNVILIDFEPAQMPSFLTDNFDKKSPTDGIVEEKDSHVVQLETISSESEMEHVFGINHEACKHQRNTEPQFLIIQLQIGLPFAAIVILKPIVPFLVMLKKLSLDAQCFIQHRPPPKPPPEPPPTAACFPHFLLSLLCSPPVR